MRVISLFFEGGTDEYSTGIREARELFKFGKNRDGAFTNDHLYNQTDKALDIFEAKMHGFAQALVIFDNAPTHRKRPDDGLSAMRMPKGPRESWTRVKGGQKMRDGFFRLADGTKAAQSFYYPADHSTMPGWFKGMEQILRERNLWRDGLLADCGSNGFGCKNSPISDCCCRKIMYCQEDFQTQKSRLEELVESRGHICDFYPKFHCELNFIEQYWGAAKLRYRSTARTTGLAEMERTMKACLDDIPLVQIRR